MDSKCLITFKITAMAFKFENYCDKYDLDTEMVPVPRELSDSCGYSCRINPKEIEDILELCEEKNIQFGSIYKKEQDNYTKLY